MLAQVDVEHVDRILRRGRESLLLHALEQLLEREGSRGLFESLVDEVDHAGARDGSCARAGLAGAFRTPP